MTTSYQPQTTSDTMARIAAGVDPWMAYRDFLEDWTYIPGSRTDLIAATPAFERREHSQWASLLAATVEALCLRDGVPVPSWTGDPGFRLQDPWYLYEGTGRIRQWLRESTPAPFSTRNTWSGDRLLRRT